MIRQNGRVWELAPVLVSISCGDEHGYNAGGEIVGIELAG